MVVFGKSQLPKCRLRIGSKSTIQVDKFKYLGSMILPDGKCDQDIRIRIGMVKEAFKKNEAHFGKSKAFNEDGKSYFALLHSSHSDVWCGVLDHFTENEEMYRSKGSVVPQRNAGYIMDVRHDQ